MLLVYIYIPRPTFLIVVFFYTDNCLRYRVIDFSSSSLSFIIFSQLCVRLLCSRYFVDRHVRHNLSLIHI